ncbi:MAG: acylneuraminate cytidylyltransferase family protein [Candidatus Pacebacteria bacterium]|nr:acylneuraminate cytidylyltransferase family protein [Candidatus Paceibacterota bacterium]
MNILGVITARGNSKGVKNKNIKPLAGKPTIYYTIEAAKKSKLLTRLVCSTEDSKIAEITKSYGVEVIKRPKALACDTARIDDVLRHTVKFLEKRDKFTTDIVVLLYANIPIRKEGIIDKTISEFIKFNPDCVMTVSDIGQFHPNWLLKVEDEKRIDLYSPTTIYRRQDLPKYYYNDGSVVAVKKEALMKNDGISLYPAFGKDIRAIIQSQHETIEIDNEYDYFLAESILNTRGKNEEI